MIVTVFCDGASRGNPGLSGAGIILLDGKNKIITFVTKFLGDNITNNAAEYHAVILAADEIIRLGLNRPRHHIKFFTDSELVVKQVSGVFVVRTSKLYPLYNKLIRLTEQIPKHTLAHVSGKKNKGADRLANLAIDLRARYLPDDPFSEM